MLRMGSVAGGRRAPDLGANELPDPLSRRRGSQAPKAGDETSPAAGGPAAADDAETGTGDGNGRARSAEHSVGFPERGGRRGTSEPGWRWKDLLSNMPEEDDPATPDNKTSRKRPSRDD